MADVKADAKPVPTPPNDVPGIRANLDALKATVAALAVRVAAIEAHTADLSDLVETEHESRIAQAVVLADLCSTMCGFLTQPVPVMTAMGELERRAKACRS